MTVALQIVIFIIMAFLVDTKVLITGKAKLDNILDALKFNIVIFAAVTVLFSAFWAQGLDVSPLTVFLALIFSLCTVVFQVLYALALKEGPIGILILINNFSAVPSAILGTVIFGEKFRVTNVLGLILVIASILLTTKNSGEEKSDSKKGYVLIMGAMILTCLGTLVQRYHQKTEFAAERNKFLFFAYLFSLIIAVALAAVLSSRKKDKVKISKKTYGFAALAGIALAIYQFLLIYMSGISNSMLMYPTLSGLTIIVNFIMCAVIFREKMTTRQKIGAALGTLAIIIMAI